MRPCPKRDALYKCLILNGLLPRAGVCQGAAALAAEPRSNEMNGENAILNSRRSAHDGERQSTGFDALAPGAGEGHLQPVVPDRQTLRSEAGQELVHTREPGHGALHQDQLATLD